MQGHPTLTTQLEANSWNGIRAAHSETRRRRGDWATSGHRRTSTSTSRWRPRQPEQGECRFRFHARADDSRTATIPEAGQGPRWVPSQATSRETEAHIGSSVTKDARLREIAVDRPNRPKFNDLKTLAASRGRLQSSSGVDRFRQSVDELRSMRSANFLERRREVSADSCAMRSARIIVEASSPRRRRSTCRRDLVSRQENGRPCSEARRRARSQSGTFRVSTTSGPARSGASSRTPTNSTLHRTSRNTSSWPRSPTMSGTSRLRTRIWRTRSCRSPCPYRRERPRRIRARIEKRRARPRGLPQQILERKSA